MARTGPRYLYRRNAGNGDVYAEACPSRAVLALVADKWTLLIHAGAARRPAPQQRT